MRPNGVDVASGVERAPRVKDRTILLGSSPPRAVRYSSRLMSAPVPHSPPGRFGAFGGRYVSETLIPSLDELTNAWAAAQADPAFTEELGRLLTDYVGRPTPLGFAARLSDEVGREIGRALRIYLKREDLCHTGAHKINNCIGQLLLARRMGKKRIIAETGAGQHGVATATACALFGIPCEIYMGAVDVERQALNVSRMKLLGAKVHAVTDGTATLKDAMNEALRDWVTNVRTTHYVIGSVAGPHPYPLLVRDLQAVIGREARAQIQEAEGRLPDACVACVGGGSNAMGLFHAFVPDASVKLYGVEAAGDGIDTDRHAATLAKGRIGVLHGARSYVLCDEDGQISEAHSISAGLDYPGVGPEHSFLKETARARYFSVTDDEALAGFQRLARTEGILCALESAHAIAALPKVASELPEGAVLIVNVSGRGDKDMGTIVKRLGVGTVSRLAARFARAREEKRAALIIYLTADDPDGETSQRLMLEAAAAGADIIEVGIPWSDPSADGKVIQAAVHRARARGAACGAHWRSAGRCATPTRTLASCYSATPTPSW